MAQPLLFSLLERPDLDGKDAGLSVAPVVMPELARGHVERRARFFVEAEGAPVALACF